MAELQEQIKVVAEARQKLEQATEARVQAYNKWREDNQVIFTIGEGSLKVCEEAEAKLRELTLQAYAETGNKAPAKGVSIKIFQVLSYDQEEAMKWASEHRVALKLDATTFEKIAKVDKPSFVTINEEPRAQIAQKLEVPNA